MKKSILGSFVGLAIIIAIDSFSRVVVSLYMQHDIMMIAYTAYPGIFWPLMLTLIAGFAAFFGSMFGLTYGRDHRVVTVSLLIALVLFLRYGQLHLLMGQEALFYPITALVLSLGGILLAWQLTKNRQPSDDFTHHQPVEEEL
ncbi:MAG: hypothetical protein WEA56_00420 [Balneolaceae bacterium]